jgi:hypothetical protein
VSRLRLPRPGSPASLTEVITCEAQAQSGLTSTLLIALVPSFLTGVSIDAQDIAACSNGHWKRGARFIIYNRANPSSRILLV